MVTSLHAEAINLAAKDRNAPNCEHAEIRAGSPLRERRQAQRTSVLI
jgi:hypothetical protein